MQRYTALNKHSLMNLASAVCTEVEISTGNPWTRE